MTLMELSDVQARIEGAHGWTQRATGAMAQRASLAEMQALLRQAELAAVPLAERAKLLRAEQHARWWRERASAALLKRGCTLDMCSAVAGNGHYDLLGDDGEWSASLACSYCTGDDPMETSQFMVGCDTCERWYHGPCVSMSKAAADSIDTYLCPECAKLAQLPYAFGPPAPSLKRTRRPRLRLVCALLDEAQEIGVEMPEVVLIRELQADAVTWQEKAKEIQACEGTIDADELDAMLLEGEACEVEPEALFALRLAGTRTCVMQEDWAASRQAQATRKGGKGALPKDDGERVAEGRLDTMAGMHTQVAALRLPAAQLESARADYATSCAFRTTALALLRKQQPEVAELCSVVSMAAEQGSLEFLATKLAIKRQELLQQLAPSLALPLETPTILIEPTATASKLNAGSISAPEPEDKGRAANIMLGPT